MFENVSVTGLNGFVLAGGIALGLAGLLLILGTVGERVVAASALCTVGGAAWMALQGSPILHYRYLTFAHLFFVLSAALLCGRLLRNELTTSLCVVLVVDSAWLYWNYRERLGAPERGGLILAGEAISAEAEPGDIVVCVDPHTFFSFRYSVKELPCYIQDGRSTVRWEGLAAMVDADWIASTFWEDSVRRRVWVARLDGHRGSPGLSSIPENWEMVREHRFPESFDGRARTVRALLYQRVEDWSKRKKPR